MADLKISQLPDAAVPLEDEDYIPVVQGTDTGEPSTNKVRVSELKQAVEVMGGKLDNAFKFPVSEGNTNEHAAEILYPKNAYYAGGYGFASGTKITGILEIRLPENFYNNRIVKIKGKIERNNPYETINFELGGYFSGNTTNNWWSIYGGATWSRSLNDLQDLRVRFGYTNVGGSTIPTIYIGEITTEWCGYGSFIIEQVSINNDPISDEQLEGMKNNWSVKIIDNEDIISNLTTNFVPETDSYITDADIIISLQGPNFIHNKATLVPENGKVFAKGQKYYDGNFWSYEAVEDNTVIRKPDSAFITISSNGQIYFDPGTNKWYRYLDNEEFPLTWSIPEGFKKVNFWAMLSQPFTDGEGELIFENSDGLPVSFQNSGANAIKTYQDDPTIIFVRDEQYNRVTGRLRSGYVPYSPNPINKMSLNITVPEPMQFIYAEVIY